MNKFLVALMGLGATTLVVGVMSNIPVETSHADAPQLSSAAASAASESAASVRKAVELQYNLSQAPREQALTARRLAGPQLRAEAEAMLKSARDNKADRAKRFQQAVSDVIAADSAYQSSLRAASQRLMERQLKSSFLDLGGEIADWEVHELKASSNKVEAKFSYTVEVDFVEDIAGQWKLFTPREEYIGTATLENAGSGWKVITLNTNKKEVVAPQ